MKKTRVVVVRHHPQSVLGPFSASLEDSHWIQEWGNNPGEAIANLRFRVLNEQAKEYPKKIKVRW